MDSYLLEENEFSMENNKTYEGMLTQGNGYLSIRASFEEGLLSAPQNEEYIRNMSSVTTEQQRHPISKQGVFIPLIMGKNPYLNEVIINLPYLPAIQITVNGTPVDMEKAEIQNYKRTLDMKTGILRRSFVFSCKETQIGFQFERFISQKQKHLLVQKVEASVEKGRGCIEVRVGMDGDVTTNGYRHFKEIRTNAKKEEAQAGLSLWTDLGYEVCAHMAVESSHLMSWEKEEKERSVYLCGNCSLKEGETLEIVKKTVITTSRDLEKEDAKKRCRNLLDAAISMDYDSLRTEQEIEWQKKWEESDVFIQGNEALEKGLHFSIYHLLRSNMEEDCRVQICAKGFAGEAYYGRFFWDSEIFLLPFFIYTNPKAAKNMIMYRYHTLDGARKNAAAYHCKGARYPWQSGIDGTEQCSLWEYADNEVHITADVAYGVMHYYKATEDKEFMLEAGLEILIETARFWLCRVDWDTQGIPHLLNVMGPDEYSPMTKDNAYTNCLVKENLFFAVQMLAALWKTEGEAVNQIVERLSFTEKEREEMLETANKLPLPYDEKRRLFLQSEDFEEYAKIDLDSLWKDKTKAFGHFVTQEKIYRSRCIKQADVLEMMALFPNKFTREEVENAYNYYLPYTTHDSSLSPALHLLTAHRLGKEQDEEKFLNQVLEVDLCVEKKGCEDGIHIANCGCLWQAVIYGFAGLSSGVNQEELKLNPMLPLNISKLQFSIFWKGEKKKITIRQKDGITTTEITKGTTYEDKK
ncbi:MAG: beta-phosphoglucomutase [Acetivibrio sp.]